MAEPKSVGRLLGYERTNYDEKITTFIKRVKEQIDVVRIGIRDGSVNDPKVSEKYAKKAERFLSTPFFTDAKNLQKRVKDLKRYLKIVVGEEKELITIIEEWLTNKRSNKVLLANTYSSKKDSSFSYQLEIERFYDRDIEYLYGILPRYKSELILLNKLKGVLTNEEFLKSIGVKNSWKVGTLKSALSEWALDFPLGVEFELNELFTLPFFKGKKYIEMDVRDFKLIIDVRTSILENIVAWIDSEIKDSTLEKENSKKNSQGKTIYDLYREYDNFITKFNTCKNVYKEMYSLNRFGQGLIESDLFDTLYK